MSCDLSFDPRDPYQPLPEAPGIEWALQVFTTVNGYGLDGEDRSTTPHEQHVFGYARLGQQVRIDDGGATVRIEHDGQHWTFHISAEHSEPIKSVKLLIRGLPPDAVAGGWWNPSSPRDRRQSPPFQWHYPSDEWATRWAGADNVAISIDSPTVSAAVLHVATPPYGAGEQIEIVHAVPASTWSTAVTVPPIRLTLVADPDGLQRDLSAHIRRVRARFGIQAWEKRRDLPNWARELDLVVTLHGQHWTGYIFHTFAQMENRLQALASLVDPTRVLVYLPGWEGRYYYDYPNYEPGAELGGSVGFAHLVEAAHRLGYRLMPMFGANGANTVRYPGWEAASLRNPSNRYPAILNTPDWDGDRLPEGDQVFLNPGEPAFQAHLLASVSSLVERFGVDAAFFDTAGFWFDDPRYPLYDGYRDLVDQLRARHPELLLVSEGWWDAMTALFPMSQHWLGVERDIAYPRLITDVARTTSHLAEGTPGTGSTGVHEQGYRSFRPPSSLPGHLPAISFADGDGGEQFDVIRAWQRRRSAAG